MEVEVRTSKELDALMALRASSRLSLGIERALNGVPEDYHGRAWWYKEMGIEDRDVARRKLAQLRDVGVAVALAQVEVLDRIVMVGSRVESEGSSGAEGRGSRAKDR